MAEGGDHLDKEISVSAELTESKINASVKSRFVAALDRLGGSILDVPVAKLESIAQEIRAESVAKQALIKVEGDTAEKKLLSSPEFGDRVVSGFLKDQTRKQINRDAIMIEAAELLRLPKPDDETNETLLDDDWLNTFDRYAGEASSDRFRRLWAQVLTGEIRRPGKFSLTTLRFMSELDAQIARLFEAAVATRSFEGYIIKPKGLKGADLLDFTFLQEIGLLHDGDLKIGMNVAADGNIYFEEDSYGLIIKPKNSKLPIDLRIVRITRIGQEITSILPEADKKAFLEKVAAVIADKAEAIELVELSGDKGNKTGHLIKKIL